MIDSDSFRKKRQSCMLAALLPFFFWGQPFVLRCTHLDGIVHPCTPSKQSHPSEIPKFVGILYFVDSAHSHCQCRFPYVKKITDKLKVKSTNLHCQSCQDDLPIRVPVPVSFKRFTLAMFMRLLRRGCSGIAANKGQEFPKTKHAHVNIHI